jgi:hypothetical protein
MKNNYLGILALMQRLVPTKQSSRRIRSLFELRTEQHFESVRCLFPVQILSVQ